MDRSALVIFYPHLNIHIILFIRDTWTRPVTSLTYFINRYGGVMATVTTGARSVTRLVEASLSSRRRNYLSNMPWDFGTERNNKHLMGTCY